MESTELLRAAGDRGGELTQDHLALLRRAIAATGGREVKSLGDGIMGVFDSAADGISCAIAIQRAVHRANLASDSDLQVRVGVSAGDVTQHHGDYYGLPVVEGARLCAAAAGAEVLVSDVVKRLAGGSGGLSFAAVGPLALKGLGDPVPAWRLDWRSGEHGAVPLPTGLVRSASGGWFVGREAELAHVGGAWAEALGGKLRGVLLAGDPGLGKTRLSAELAQRAQEDDALVLYGRADRELAVPFRPWIGALRRVLEFADEELLAAHVATHGGELTRLLPELGYRLPAVPPPRDADPDTERQAMFDAAVGLLVACADRRPVLLVLDDLHCADRQTLVLLRELLRAPDVPLLVVAAYRTAEADQGPALRETLGELAREACVSRCDLEPLDRGDTIALVAAVSGTTHPEAAQVELADEVFREAGGHPLFTTELLRHVTRDAPPARDGSGGLQLPGTVRDVIAQRAASLGPEAEPVLRTAAVIGQVFDFELLSFVLEAPEEQVVETLDRAAAARLVSEDPGRPGRFAFSHALVQHALAEEVSGLRRRRLHARLAARLEEVAPGPVRAGEVARHWLEAGEPARATDAAVQAGDHAMHVHAPEEAVGWYDAALDALRSAGDDIRVRECDLLITLAEAGGQAGMEGWREHAFAAAGIARSLGDPDRLARAALASNRGVHSDYNAIDDERIALLREALDAVGSAVSAHRTRLLATLSSELWHDVEGRVPVADAALAAARELGDDRILFDVLYRRNLTVARPATVGERLAVTEEMLGLAGRLHDPLSELLACAERMRVCVEAGRPEWHTRAEAAASLVRPAGSALGHLAAGWIPALLAAWEGDHGRAEKLAIAFAEEAQHRGANDAPALLVSMLTALRWDEGRLGELADLPLAYGDTAPGVEVRHAFAAFALAGAGRLGEASERLEAGLSRGFPLTDDVLWTTGAVFWSEVAAETGNETAARIWLERLEPWTDQYGYSGIAFYGSLARAAGRLAALLERHEDAGRLFAAGLELDERIGAVGPLARCRLHAGAWRLSRGDASGRELVESAREVAERHRLEGIAAPARALLAAAAV